MLDAVPPQDNNIVHATSPSFGRTYRATPADDMPSMFGLTDEQFEVLESEMRRGAAVLMGNRAFGMDPDEDDVNTMHLLGMIKVVKDEHLMKLPNYNPPEHLDDLLWLLITAPNNQQESNRSETPETPKNPSASVDEILNLERRMYEINSNIEYEEDTRNRVATEAWFNGPTRKQQRYILKKGQNMMKALVEFKHLQERVMDLEDKLGEDERAELEEERGARY